MTTKIALDSWVLSSRFRNHGIYAYARSLFREFARKPIEHDLEFCLFTSPGNHNDASELPRGPNFHHWPTRLLQHKHLWRLAGASRSARAEKADLLFAPSATVLPSSVPMVCTIHDTTPLRQPSSRATVNLMQRIFGRFIGPTDEPKSRAQPGLTRRASPVIASEDRSLPLAAE